MVNITFTLNANPYILSSPQNVRNLHYAVGCVLRTPVKNITIQDISYIDDAGYKRGLLANPSVIQNDTQNCQPLVLTTGRLLQTTTESIVDITVQYPSVDVQAMDVSSLIGVITTSNQFQAYAPPASTPTPPQTTTTLSTGGIIGITIGALGLTMLVTCAALFIVRKQNKTPVLTAVANPSYREKHAFVPIRV